MCGPTSLKHPPQIVRELLRLLICRKMASFIVLGLEDDIPEQTHPPNFEHEQATAGGVNSEPYDFGKRATSRGKCDIPRGTDVQRTPRKKFLLPPVIS